MITLSFTTSFDLQNSPKIFVLKDTSDYAGQGVSTADVNGCFTITSPSGIPIYTNNDFSDGACNIHVAVSTTNQIVIQLPLDSNGMPELGVYTLLYTVYDKNTDTYSTVTNTYTNGYVRPVITITQTVDCVSPLFVSTDATNYTVNSTAPSKLIRDHELFYPNGSAGQGSPTITSGVTINRGANQFYNGVQTTEISTELEYDFSDGLVVIDVISGVQNVTVDCTNVCSIRCCLNTLEQKVESEKASGSLSYEEDFELFSLAMGIVGLIQLNINCGYGSSVSAMLSFLKQLLNCTDGCGSTSNPNSPILGIGTILNNVVVQTGDSAIVVTPVVAGNLTTYTVTLNSAFIAQWNSVYNTRVVAGTNITSVTFDGIVGGMRQYTVNAPNPPSVTPSAQLVKNFNANGLVQIFPISNVDIAAVFGATAIPLLAIEVWMFDLIKNRWDKITNLDTITIEDDATFGVYVKTSVGIAVGTPIMVVFTGTSPIAQTNNHTNQTGITAFATGGQTNATQLLCEYNKITVCATNGDSVKAPAAVSGMRCEVSNSGAADLDLFPVSGENFEGSAVNIPVVVANGGSIVLFCYTTGTWSY